MAGYGMPMDMAEFDQFCGPFGRGDEDGVIAAEVFIDSVHCYSVKWLQHTERLRNMLSWKRDGITTRQLPMPPPVEDLLREAIVLHQISTNDESSKYIVSYHEWQCHVGPLSCHGPIQWNCLLYTLPVGESLLSILVARRDQQRVFTESEFFVIAAHLLSAIQYLHCIVKCAHGGITLSTIRVVTAVGKSATMASIKLTNFSKAIFADPLQCDSGAAHCDVWKRVARRVHRPDLLADRRRMDIRMAAMALIRVITLNAGLEEAEASARVAQCTKSWTPYGQAMAQLLPKMLTSKLTITES